MIVTCAIIAVTGIVASIIGYHRGFSDGERWEKIRNG